MITKNKFQKLLEKINVDNNEKIISEFKKYCLNNFYPFRYYENLYKNFKIVKNNYKFDNFLYKPFKLNIENDYSELYSFNNEMESLGFIGVIQEKCKPKLVSAYKNKVEFYNKGKFDIYYNYYFCFSNPLYIKNLIKENRLLFKGE